MNTEKIFLIVFFTLLMPAAWVFLTPIAKRMIREAEGRSRLERVDFAERMLAESRDYAGAEEAFRDAIHWRPRDLDLVTSHRSASCELPGIHQRLRNGDEDGADSLDRHRIS